MIPIALYVSIEMVKIVQSLVFIGQDRSMYHAETDTPAVARTSNLNEELGMVNTILSDKVGVGFFFGGERGGRGAAQCMCRWVSAIWGAYTHVVVSTCIDWPQPPAAGRRLLLGGRGQQASPTRRNARQHACLHAFACLLQTGTLTRNVMEFFKCSIGGVAYGAGITEIERNNAERWVGVGAAQHAADCAS